MVDVPDQLGREMEVVLLLGATAPHCVARLDAWRLACRKHRFDCVVWAASSKRALETHPWHQTLVVALLDATAVTLERLAAIRVAAAHALIVLSAPAIPLATGDKLDGFLLRPGQESMLLSWCRRQIDQKPAVEGLPRPTGVVNLTERTLAIDGELVRLQPREVRLLAILADYTAATCHIDVACRKLLGDANDRKRRLLRQYLYQLRQKLGRHARLVQHVPGEGYRCLLELKLVELAESSLVDSR